MLLIFFVSAPSILSAKLDSTAASTQTIDLTPGLGTIQVSQSLMSGVGAPVSDLRSAVWALRGDPTGVANGYLSGRSWSYLESGAPENNPINAVQFDGGTGMREVGGRVGDSVQLVIGVNGTGQQNYLELVDRLNKDGGRFVDAVSIGNRSQAIVADLPFSILGSFESQTEKDGLASYVEPDLTYKIDVVPNDPDWSKQWGMQKIRADWAWNTTVGEHSVLVAVVDTGIDFYHPDLTANYVALGYDWVDNDPTPMDDNGHGTHCAGVIAAALNNNLGIAGLAQVRIMAEKAIDSSGRGTSSDLAHAIVHAVQQGAKIISCSWGSYSESTIVHEAIKYAFDNGVLVVAAAGNDATSAEHYPAAFDEVVSVAATDELDNPASFSNFGDRVKVAAPGVNVYSTHLGGIYEYLSGTSMATPHVSGVAALIWSRFPNMTRDQVCAQLQGSSDDLGAPGFDIHYGFGRVNARNAVEQAPSVHDVLVLSLKAPLYLKPWGSTVLNATVLNMGESNESGISVQWLVNGSAIDSKSIDFLITGASAALNCSWTPVDSGTYNITCYVLPLIGENIVRNNSLSATVSVRNPQVIRVPQDYTKIQQAVRAAFEGDTISVAPGSYYENVRIDKEGLKLVGQDQKYTVIDGGKNADVILVIANNVEISGFTLRNGLPSLEYAGIFAASSGVTITNTTEVGNYHGIFLCDAVNAKLRNNNMTNNVYNFAVEGDTVTDFILDVDASNTLDGLPVCYLVNQHDYSVPSGSGFVAVVNCSGITVRDLRLFGNYEGLLLAGTSNSLVENVSTYQDYFGMRLTLSSNNTYQDNNASASSIGMYVDQSQNNSISYNLLQSNSEGLHLYLSTGNAIDSNELRINSRNIYLEKSDCNTIESNEVSHGNYGIYLEKSTSNTLKNNNMTGASYNFGVVGTFLSHFIQDVDVSNTVDGRPVYYWRNQKNTEVPADAGYVGIVNSTNVLVSSLNLTNNVQGVLLAYSFDCTAENVSALSNAYGIYLYCSGHNNVILNTVASAGKRGIVLIDSTDNTVRSNDITKSEIGVGSWQSSENNSIIGNIVSNGTTGPGLYLDSSNNNSLSDNIVTNNRDGIYLYNSGDNTLRNNNATACMYSFGVYGAILPHYINYVDASNVIDGKPVCYLINQHNTLVPSNVGYLAIVNSTGINVQDLSVSKSEQGVLLAYATDCLIRNVNASDNYNGIYFWYSDANVITVCNAENNGWDDIGLYYSERNTIVGCTVKTASFGIDLIASNNNTIDINKALENNVGIIVAYSSGNAIVNNNVNGGDRSLAGIALSRGARNIIRRNTVSNNPFFIGAGMYLEYSSNENSIFQNTFSDNVYGVSMGWWNRYGFKDQSSNNTIFHNNIINNVKQGLSLDSINTWDNGYPSGGNHWSDYVGTDHFHGAYQNETGSDGLGDTGYVVNENNTDRYPFLQSYVPVHGDMNHDGTVNLFDAIKEASVFGAYPGHPLWNSDADFNQDGVIDIFDLIILAGNFGKTIE